MRVKKSPVRASHRAGGFIVRRLAAILVIAISVACSASKSATTPAQLTSTETASPASTPLSGSSVKEPSVCTLTLSEAPAISRIKLGMTADEVLALFPGSKEDPEVSAAIARRGAVGNATFAITPSKHGNAPELKEVSRISLALLDGRVSTFTVHYNGPEWSHVDKFVEKFIEGKALPGADQWEPYVGLDTQMKTLTCTGFSLRLYNGGDGGSQNYVLMQDIEANNTLKERRRKAQAQASPTPGQ